MPTLLLMLTLASIHAAPAASATGQTGQQKPAARAKASPKDKLPAAIRTAFDTAYPNAIVRNVSKENEGGAVVYEVESMDGTMSRDIVYRADGTIVEMEEGITEADLPAAVRDAVAAKYPKGRITRAERLTRGDAKLFEVRVSVAGKTVDLELDAAGKPPAKAAKK